MSFPVKLADFQTIVVILFWMFVHLSADCSWSSWTTCSVSCGSGFRIRQTVCEDKLDATRKSGIFDVSNCTNACKNTMMRKIKLRPGKIIESSTKEGMINNNPKLSGTITNDSWSEWSACSNRCGNGIQVQRNNCKTCDSERFRLRLCVGQSKICTRKLIQDAVYRSQMKSQTTQHGRRNHIYYEDSLLFIIGGLCIILLLCVIYLSIRQRKNQSVKD